MQNAKQTRWPRAEILSALADAGRDVFALDELEALGMTPIQAQRAAQRLVRDNQARRLQRGLYALVHPADWRHKEAGYTADWYATAARLIHPRPYYLAYYTAMEMHRMLSHPLLTVLVATTVQKQPVVVSQVRFRFVTVAEHRFFGQEPIESRPGVTVEVATLERTFIDCTDRPSLCGGLEEIVAGFRRRHRDLDPDRLLRFLHRLGDATAAKRLGFLLETVGHDDRMLLDEIREFAGRSGTYVPLIPGTVRTHGTWREPRWELDIHVPREELSRMGTT
jgi:predicted transcriptional regulator of viral defense system